MAAGSGNEQGGDELALATRAAWLYHAGGLTQSEVAQRLGVPALKAHRLIARATRAGLVRVLIEGPIGGCVALEERLVSQFGLRLCRVVPSLGEPGLPLRALGTACASLLHEMLASEEHRIIGVGHGRTLGASIDLLPSIHAPNICFVSLLGGLTRRTGTSPFDVIHRLAEKTGGEAWLLPVPFLANTAADRAVLLAQRGIGEAVRLARQATFSLVGIGEVAGDAFLPAAGVVPAEDAQALREAGAVGEMLGHYFDAEGALIAAPLHDRVIALLPQDTGQGRLTVAVAGGPGKIEAIGAVLQSRMLDGLVTDEPTAQRLLAAPEPEATSKGNGPCTKKKKTSPKASSRGALAGVS